MVSRGSKVAIMAILNWKHDHSIDHRRTTHIPNLNVANIAADDNLAEAVSGPLRIHVSRLFEEYSFKQDPSWFMRPLYPRFS